MGTNLHKDLTDAQLHVPKGFSTASNSTILTKDSGGSLVWATDGSASISNKRLSVPFSGQISAKNASTFGNMYAREMAQLMWSSTSGEHWTGTITPRHVMNSAFYVVPADCTVEKVISKGFSTSATMECNMKLYAYRYDCSSTPTVIGENIICNPFNSATIPTDEILCNVDTSFTTSSLLAGDMLVVTFGVDLVASSFFTGQGTILLKIT